MQRAKHFAKQMAKQAVKKLVKAAGKKLLAALMPVIIALWPLWLGLFLAVLFFAAVYGSMPQEKYLTGVEASPKDREIRQQIEEAVKMQNVADYYIVPGEKPAEGETWYMNNGNAVKVGYLYNKGTGEIHYMDNNGRDAGLANRWGDVYATLFYDIVQKNEPEFPLDRVKPVAKDLHPYFYVKKSEIIRKYPVETEDGTEIETDVDDIYLLVEARTIRGWFQYEYEWHTVHYEGGRSKKYERLRDIVTIEPRWEWFSNYLVDFYGLDPGEKIITRELVVNASEAFSEEKEWFGWLMKNHGDLSWASQAMIPPDLMNFFKEAGDKYDIPWWFLAAVAYKESTFNPRAENQSSECYGLMQVSPANWRAYAPRLGFGVDTDRDNPRAQVMVGTYLLYEQGLKNIDWEGSWKEATLPVLIFYGGFRGPMAEERCRNEYAEKIWTLAQQFRDVKAGWPVQGEITSSFGWRVHPILRTRSYHEGIDISAPLGAPVVSVSGGVAAVGYGENTGNYVHVKDGMYEYAYWHLSGCAVSDGQTVEPGQIIGYVGSTGRSTGPHLHFGVRPIGGDWINPLNVLP